MRHLGDITKIRGDKIPPVDVITGGSPCQDLSVAGKRAGLDGERSGLFMEQIRIVKEMRNATGADVDIRLAKPRYMVWENVPGAFSSNKGKDFQAVLTEIIRIAQPDAPDVPMPKNAKWGGAGCIYDEMGRWSVAWRVHDAQFWGVPQRRKRIALVADFAGLSAAEILFERKGLSWNSESRIETRKGIAGDSEESAGESD
jgi:DNA (cytosine-5)-methyltransferase 1